MCNRSERMPRRLRRGFGSVRECIGVVSGAGEERASRRQATKARKNPRDAGDDGPFRGVTESAMRADAGAAEFEDEIGDHGKVDEEQDELADRGSVKEFVDFER